MKHYFYCAISVLVFGSLLLESCSKSEDLHTTSVTNFDQKEKKTRSAISSHFALAFEGTPTKTAKIYSFVGLNSNGSPNYSSLGQIRKFVSSSALPTVPLTNVSGLAINPYNGPTGYCLAKPSSPANANWEIYSFDLSNISGVGGGASLYSTINNSGLLALSDLDFVPITSSVGPSYFVLLNNTQGTISSIPISSGLQTITNSTSSYLPTPNSQNLVIKGITRIGLATNGQVGLLAVGSSNGVNLPYVITCNNLTPIYSQPLANYLLYPSVAPAGIFNYDGGVLHDPASGNFMVAGGSLTNSTLRINSTPNYGSTVSPTPLPAWRNAFINNVSGAQIRFIDFAIY